MITNKAYELNIPYVAIVDSDWNIQKNYSFVRNIILTLMDYKYDILIPNIGMSAGRSNILIGKTVVNLFYPEYKDVLLTPFPGAVVAVTNKLYMIVNNKNYHYDWGGEWDIISLAIKNNMKINTSFVEVLPARHRPNDSKIKDSFQIWRAILSNEDIINRFDNLIKYDKKVKPYNKLSKLLLNKNNSINEMIDIIEKNSSTETEQQLLYMILYPIAYILGKIDDVSIMESSNKVLYDEAEINMISDLAIYCCRLALISCDIAKVCDKSKKINGKYFSSWSIETQNKAIKEYEVI